MPVNRRFQPTLSDTLESRELLSRSFGFAPGGVAPVQFARSNVSGRASTLVQSVNDQINESFESFKRDFLEAQGAYFASPQAQGVEAQRYFRGFISERLNLLSQELTRTFVHVPGSLNRVSAASPGGSLVLQVFMRNRITGNGPAGLQRSLIGLGPGSSRIPLVGTVSGPTITLYTNQALAAIDNARAATINATGFLLNDTFKNGSH